MTTNLLCIIQDGSDRRYVDMAEHLYSSLMPAIRKKMVQDGYEFYNVQVLDPESVTYRYLYVKSSTRPKPVEYYPGYVMPVL